MTGDQNGPRLHDYIEHMLEAIRLVRTYTAGMSKAAFVADKRTQQAVILNLIVIGEAAARLSAHHAAFITEHAEVPWGQMRGMRNRMAHGYFDINVDVVWETAQRSLPKLEEQLVALRMP
jgi:uncharacterized protein with HEPN domain